MIVVAIPFRAAGCQYRSDAFSAVQAHLQAAFDTVSVVDDSDDPFSRGGSLNTAFANQSDDTIVIACDADLIIPLEQLTEAVALARQSDGLVQPFNRLHYRRRDGGEQIMPLSPTIPLLGGCNVLSRATWRLAGGWLPALRGWGCEDIAFATQTGGLVAATRRIEGPATHLYHPKSGVYADEATVARNGALMRQVTGATDTEALRVVIRELGGLA